MSCGSSRPLHFNIARVKTARGESQEKPEWGEGDDGFKRPRTPADRMRCVLVSCAYEEVLMRWMQEERAVQSEYS